MVITSGPLWWGLAQGCRTFFLSKPGVGQNIAFHAVPADRKSTGIETPDRNGQRYQHLLYFMGYFLQEQYQRHSLLDISLKYCVSCMYVLPWFFSQSCDNRYGLLDWKQAINQSINQSRLYQLNLFPNDSVSHPHAQWIDILLAIAIHRGGLGEGGGVTGVPETPPRPGSL